MRSEEAEHLAVADFQPELCRHGTFATARLAAWTPLAQVGKLRLHIAQEGTAGAVDPRGLLPGNRPEPDLPETRPSSGRGRGLREAPLHPALAHLLPRQWGDWRLRRALDLRRS